MPLTGDPPVEQAAPQRAAPQRAAPGRAGPPPADDPAALKAVPVRRPWRWARVVPLLRVATAWYIPLATVLSVLQHYVDRHFSEGATR
ncbi:hypothetical protein [Streptomyces inhibens]|uniref:hypothetical protein n=1 Tax=Streptomyces inhibens TaxID=2293571 RepID=UPI001EE69CDC|nr:hypothetical protein [Streptomyces inhibens]UKY49312.1 hypothetical protein KI385_11205 [Streptomyces inhibens]